MKPQTCIPINIRDIKTKSQALNYCLLICRKSHAVLGCAYDCELRKKWKIPPHGNKYYEEKTKLKEAETEKGEGSGNRKRRRKRNHEFC